jgi:hypothetical protein
MNVFTGLSSVQGYGSLISTNYDNATGTHPQATLNPCRLADGTFTQLRLDAIAISAGELATNTLLGPTPTTGCVPNKPALSTRRYFGQLLKVHTIILTGAPDKVLSTGALHLELLSRDGTPMGPGLAVAGASPKKVVFESSHPQLAAGFVVTSNASVVVGHAVVTPYGSGPSYELDTDFQIALSSSSWRLNSTQDQFSVFKATTLRPRAWLTSSASSGRVTKIRGSSWGDAWISVTLNKSSVLDRSEAYLPGWRATAVNDATGRVVDLTVQRAGLIQSVSVPMGTWTIHFHYHAPYIELSSAASAASVVLFVAVVSGLAIKRRRKRNAKVLS